ncbi:MAG: SulP family inorganic anion transporter [Bryobacteraceae bacterium]
MRDFWASIVVFFVALPLCMGIAIASGAPPALGLITGIVGGLVVGFLAGSPLQVSGPAAGLAVLTYQLIQEHGLVVLGPVVLLAGLLQLVSGYFKVGQFFRAISPAVIHGMLAGIGVLIFAAQFHVMVDDSPGASGIANLLSIPRAIAKGVFPLSDTHPHHLAAMVGVVTLLVLVGWNTLAPKQLSRVPGALVAVIAGSALAGLAGWEIKFVDVPSNLIAAANWATPEAMQTVFNPTLLAEIVAMAFVASAETLLCASAVDQMHSGPRTNYDRELMAQGFGNMICGVFGALPMTGVIVRSAANVNAGGETRKSAIMHGAWLLAFVALAPGVLNLVPTASLAAILVYTGYKLVNIRNIRRMAYYGRPVLAVYLITLTVIVVKSLLLGILVGLTLSFAKLIYALTHMGIRIVTDPAARRVDLHLSGAATFVRLPKLTDTLEATPLDHEAHVHFKDLEYIDHACMDALSNWEMQRKEKGAPVFVEWNELTRKYRRSNALDTPPDNPPGSAVRERAAA